MRLSRLAQWPRQLSWSGAKHYWAAALALVLGGIATLVVSYMVVSDHVRIYTSAFEAQARERAQVLQNGFENYEVALQGLGTFMQAFDNARVCGQFSPVANTIFQREGGVRSLIWAPRIMQSNRAAFEMEASRELKMGRYEILENVAARRPVAAAAREEYYPVYCNVALSGDAARLASLGFDVWSEPMRRRLLETARDSGHAITTPIIDLIDSQNGAKSTKGLLLFVPTYQRNTPAETVEERRQHITGFVFGVFGFESMISQIIRVSGLPQGLDLYFYGRSPPETGALIHFHPSPLRSAPIAPLDAAGLAHTLHREFPLSLGGREWSVTVVDDSPPERDVTAYVTATGGIAFTVLTAFYLATTARRRKELETLSGSLRETATKLEEETNQRGVALAELKHHEELLQAMTRTAGALLGATVLEEAMPRVLKIAGEALNASHLLVFERHAGPDGSTLVSARYGWGSGSVETRQLLDMMQARPTNLPGMEAMVDADPDTSSGFIVKDMGPEVRESLAPFHIRSILCVPIFVDNRPWGHVSLDEVRTDRHWTWPEVDTVKTLARLIGISIARAQSLQKLAYADRIVQNSPTILFRALADPDLSLTYISSNVSRYGYAADEFVSEPGKYLRLMHPDDVQEYRAKIQRILAGQADRVRQEFRMRTPDGTYLWFESTVNASRDADGRLAGFEGLALDITDRKRAEDKIGYSNALLTTAMENSPDGILVVDVSGRILSVNQRFLDMWNIRHQVVEGDGNQALLVAAKILLKDPGEFAARVRYLNEHPEEKSHDELALLDGRIFDRQTQSMRGPNGESLGRIWFFRDITERKAAEDKIAALARIDSLTVLANRATFLDRLQQAFASVRRGAAPFAVHFLDLDRFKNTNDTLGHAAGDALLKGVADRLRMCTRETDVVARFGGDEFAILQMDVPDPSEAGTLALKIRAALAEPYDLEDGQVSITASVGIAVYEAGTVGPAEILAQADHALYCAKEEGRDRYRFHSDEIGAAVRDRLAIADELSHAVERGELEVYYQPQVAIASNEIVGMEALVRWRHTTRGLLSPGQFIPAAEKSGAIIAMGRWVLESVCRQIAEWHDKGIAPLVVAINVSAVQLKLATEFERDLKAALEEWNVPPTGIELDITEQVLTEMLRINSPVMERLRVLGIGIAIDDFGSQYSSIGFLNSYKVKRLKIAPQFIGAVTSNPADATVVIAMMNLARQFDLEVVAEGVETAAQRSFLLAAAASTKAQGYYYSRPVSAKEAEDLLRNRKIDASTVLPDAAQ